VGKGVGTPEGEKGTDSEGRVPSKTAERNAMKKWGKKHSFKCRRGEGEGREAYIRDREGRGEKKDL